MAITAATNAASALPGKMARDRRPARAGVFMDGGSALLPNIFPRPRCLLSIRHGFFSSSHIGHGRRSYPIARSNNYASRPSIKQAINRVVELNFRVRLTKALCAFNKQSFHFVGNEIACRVEHTQIWPKLDCLVC